ncbi:hypothetical protein CALCODRAFT_80380 [Calocera cornea HHB12733]|uniref:F-box domain-containing protein n=1 Tax=Calocera cornea HHB12733 TaxID=1353952 RepID=A0A165DEY6_9BASI|nr:hypothetical protein CALCODRAFT_80380 [Calocera cornea HHB12733]
MSNNTPSLSDTTLTPDMTPVDASPGPIVDQHQPRAKKRRIKRSEETMDIPGRGSKIYTNAPIEIFLEILSYLDPLDILKISQTSKTLRGFLNDKESQYIWRQARANVPGLPPDLPVDFTEPQYAAYLFQEICQVCGGTTKKFGRIGLAALRVRLCSKCTVQHCMNAGPAAKILGGIQRLLLIPGYSMFHSVLRYAYSD